MTSEGPPAAGLLAGRTAVVTGATSGIGYELARGLAGLGATTVVVGRGEARAAQVAAELGAATGNPRVGSLGVTDLALRTEVRRVAEELLRRFPMIHILVNNAGAIYGRRELTSEGLERTVALNLVTPFLLTSLLAPRLIASAPARVVNIASAAHRGQRVRFDDLQGARRYRAYRAYGRSKLELILISREFARRLNGSGVAVNAVHPGFVRSGFAQTSQGGTSFLIRVMARLFGRSLRSGAATPLWVAADPSMAGVTGQYVSHRRVVPGSPQSRVEADARRLYQVLREISDAPEV